MVTNDEGLIRTVIASRLGFALASSIFALGFTRGVPLLPAVIALLIGAALAGPPVHAWVRRAAPEQRARALRHAELVTGPIGAIVALPFAILEQGFELGRAIAMAPYVALLGVVMAAFGHLLSATLLPAAWRVPEPRVWRPSARQRRTLLLAWPLATWLLFELVVAATASHEYGAPFRFLVTDTPPRFDTRAFVSDLVFFGLLGPAIYGLATSRLRVLFVAYLLGMLSWLGVVLVQHWAGSAGTWWVLVLRG
jgi:hypothetical protein